MWGFPWADFDSVRSRKESASACGFQRYVTSEETVWQLFRRQGFSARAGSGITIKRAMQYPSSESEKTTLISPRDILCCGQPKEGRNQQSDGLKRMVRVLVAETTLNERTQLQPQGFKERLRFKVAGLPLPESLLDFPRAGCHGCPPVQIGKIIAESLEGDTWFGWRKKRPTFPLMSAATGSYRITKLSPAPNRVVLIGGRSSGSRRSPRQTIPRNSAAPRL